MELFPFTLPKSSICKETGLYYHSSKNVLYKETTGEIIFDCNTALILDTYFNCFSYQKYLKYTHAEILEINIKLQGNIRVCLMKAEMKGKRLKRTELIAQEIRNKELQIVMLSYDFSAEKGNGIFYLELTALSAKAVFAGGYYSTSAENENVNDVKIAAVICTYHREEYIKRNLNYLANTIFAKPDSEIVKQLQVFVIDNGQTINSGEIENTHVKLFPNKNYGGSGGFARGIIEVLRSKEKFSHVLLMDDDILFESNVFIKTIRFLQLLRPEYQDLVLGASMLCLNKMGMQNEAGARWTGMQIKQENHGLDLRSVEALLQNENFEIPQYTAWWYCCIPLSLIDKNQLPLPFFIKIDDIEYSLRMFHKILIINGIGVWHEVYEKKQVPWLDYYNMRNKLVLNTIYEESLLKNIFLLGGYIGRCLISGTSTMIEFPIQGCRDYLKGIQYFKVTESDLQHKIILDNYQKLLQNRGNTFGYWGKAIKEYVVLAVEIISRNKQLRDEYKTELKQITSESYWSEKLGIERENVL